MKNLLLWKLKAGGRECRRHVWKIPRYEIDPILGEPVSIESGSSLERAWAISRQSENFSSMVIFCRDSKFRIPKAMADFRQRWNSNSYGGFRTALEFQQQWPNSDSAGVPTAMAEFRQRWNSNSNGRISTALEFQQHWQNSDSAGIPTAVAEFRRSRRHIDDDHDGMMNFSNKNVRPQRLSPADWA